MSKCYRTFVPLVPTVFGHAASKNEEVDQMKSSKAKFIEHEYKASREQEESERVAPEFLSLGVLMSSFAELS